MTDALNSGCECILCETESKAVRDAVSFYCGPSMMEPDTRIETNKKGFCKKHYDMLLEKGEKLSIALILQTRLQEVISYLEFTPSVKKKFFRSKTKNDTKKESLQNSFSGCAVCDRIEEQMSKCTDNFAFLLDKEPDFKKKFFESSGLCMKHFINVLDYIHDPRLLNELATKQRGSISELKKDIDRFILKFDYRNSNMQWENAQNSPERSVNMLRGK